MKATEMLNQIKEVLSIQVNLEEQKLENGTVVEAESFVKGKEIFIKTDDEKVAMPVGEYLLEDGRLVVVKEEGIIDDVREVSDEVPQKEMEEEKKDEEETVDLEDDGKEAAVYDWQGMEKRIKNLEDAIADLKSRMGEKSVETNEEEKKEEEDKKENLSAAAAPIKHSPEAETQKKLYQFSKNRAETTLDRVFCQELFLLYFLRTDTVSFEFLLLGCV